MAYSFYTCLLIIMIRSDINYEIRKIYIYILIRNCTQTMTIIKKKSFNHLLVSLGIPETMDLTDLSDLCVFSKQ